MYVYIHYDGAYKRHKVEHFCGVYKLLVYVVIQLKAVGGFNII